MESTVLDPGKEVKKWNVETEKRIIYLYVSSTWKVCIPNSHQTKNEPGTVFWKVMLSIIWGTELSLLVKRDIHIIFIICMNILKMVLVTSKLNKLSTALPYLKNKVQPAQQSRCSAIWPHALFPTVPSSTFKKPSILAKLRPIHLLLSYFSSFAQTVFSIWNIFSTSDNKIRHPAQISILPRSIPWSLLNSSFPKLPNPLITSKIYKSLGN